MKLNRLALLVAISTLAVIPTASHAAAASAAAASAAADSPSCAAFARFESADSPRHPKIDNLRHRISDQPGAAAGIDMLAHPQTSTPASVPGKALEVDFSDCGQVASKTSKEGVIDEWSPLDPASGHQLKTYAKDADTVPVGSVNDPEGEPLEPTKVEQLSTAQLGRANHAALTLERSAYRTTADHRTTQPVRWGAVPPKGY